MVCYHPLKGFVLGQKDNGRRDLRITSYEADYVVMRPGLTGAEPMIGEVPSCLPFGWRVILDFIEIPCGQCIGCRIDRSRQWADRCMLEAGYHTSNYFLTLTYDDDHVPMSSYIDEDGCVQMSQTLYKQHFTAFIKRLRARLAYAGKPEIRFFMCGEYGSTTFRPHYHAIMFGLELDDLKLYKRSRGYTYYNSELLQTCWPHGYVVVGAVTWETSAYVARYCLKKLTGKAAVLYSDLGVEPEYNNMSRKPGIAAQYYYDHPEMYDYDEIYLSLPSGGRKIRPCRYYDKLYDLDNPVKMQLIRDRRSRYGEEVKRGKLKRTDLSYCDMLGAAEAHKRRQLEKLKRSDC